MIVEAAYEAYEDAGIENPQQQIEAVFCGAQYPSKGTAEVADALKLYDRPVSMVRQLLRHRHRRLPLRRLRGRLRHVRHRAGRRLRQAEGSRRVRARASPSPACAACRRRRPAGSRSAPRSYFETYGAGREDLAKIAVKNHHNGTLAPKSMLKREITVDDVLKAPHHLVAVRPLRLRRAVRRRRRGDPHRRELAKSFRDDFVLVRGIGIALAAEPAGGSRASTSCAGSRPSTPRSRSTRRPASPIRARRSTSRRCTTASR